VEDHGLLALEGKQKFDSAFTSLDISRMPRVARVLRKRDNCHLGAVLKRKSVGDAGQLPRPVVDSFVGSE
jgi:hypothetical protein